MPKRKRLSPSPSPLADETSLSNALSRQRKLCSQRIATAQKSLVSALRLGATFERQKYSRRKKTAEEHNDQKATSRLDAEYAVLKRLDLNTVAQQHLRKTIAKVKSIRDNEGLPRSMLVVEKGENNPTMLNVTARLYKVESVRKVVDEVIEDLKEILLASNRTQTLESSRREINASRGKKGRVLQEEEEEDEDTFEGFSDENEVYDDDDAFAAFDARIAAPSSAEEDSDGSLLDDNRPPSVENSDREYTELETENSAEFTDDSDAVMPREGCIITSDHDASGASSASGDGGDSDFEEQPKHTKAKTTFPTEKATKSTFLPILSHATFYSGSESEASDIEDVVAPRKNRRGQRERQKIWELKYGEEAKHLKNPEKNTKWDPKRGAVNAKGNGRSSHGGTGGKKGFFKNGHDVERNEKGVSKLAPKKVTKRDDIGPLHPSWQAAKAAKEKKIDMKPQGQKITFD